MFGPIPLSLSWPVYVSHAEATAYARWAGPERCRPKRSGTGQLTVPRRAGNASILGQYSLLTLGREEIFNHAELGRNAC